MVLGLNKVNIKEPTIIEQLSEHFETKESLPKDLIEKLVKSKNVNQGLTNLRQIFFATFDMNLHLDQPVELLDLWKQLREDIALVPMSTGTHPYSTFGHIMGGCKFVNYR